MFRKELYSLAAFSRLCVELGVSLDMMVEIYEYYIWQPKEFDLYFNTSVFSERIMWDHIDFQNRCQYTFYDRIYEFIIEILRDYRWITNFSLRNDTIYYNGKTIKINREEKIAIMMKTIYDTKIIWTSEELFGEVGFNSPFSFTIVFE